jgi:hypothetical protein
MNFFKTDMLKKYYLLFGKTNDTECEYKSICSGYNNNSQTCINESNKYLCGIYNFFKT